MFSRENCQIEFSDSLIDVRIGPVALSIVENGLALVQFVGRTIFLIITGRSHRYQTSEKQNKTGRKTP